MLGGIYKARPIPSQNNRSVNILSLLRNFSTSVELDKA